MSNEHVVEDADGAAGSLDPEERSALEEAGVDPEAVLARRCSYRTLLEAGLEEAQANDLRRRWSLPWSFHGEGDLERRSAAVAGLGEREREWVAASANGEWQAFEAARTRADEDEDADAPRSWSRPTPVTAVAGVGPDDAHRLAEAGITSADRLATIHAAEVADVLDLDVVHVRTWRHNARELLDDAT